MRILLMFIDGIGIGENDNTHNPLSIAHMPNLISLTNGKRWVKGIGNQQNNRALFRPIDPRMSIVGRPQSGSGHATIITGLPIPQHIGEHYGPKPNAATRAIVDKRNFFIELTNAGKLADLLTAYPPALLHNIKRGKTLPSAFQQAAMTSGLSLHSADDLRAGNAVSADWTGEGWASHLGVPDIPVLSLEEAGERIANLASRFHFSVQSHVFTDFVGHRGTLDDGVHLLERLDKVFGSLLEHWDDNDLIILTSDHGNMEYIGDRRHTINDVPLLAVGAARNAFQKVETLADIVPTMRRLLLT